MERSELIAKFEALQKRYDFLNDPMYIVKTSTSKYYVQVQEYKKKLKELWGKNVINSLDKTIDTIDKGVLQNVTKYIKTGIINKPKSTRKLKKSLYNSFLRDFDKTLSSLEQTLINKKTYFDVNVSSRTVSKNELNQLDSRLKINKISLNEYVTDRAIRQIDDEASQLYGTSKTVKYKTAANNGEGTNYPLTSHLENKLNTLNSDTERAIVDARAHELKIYTVQVSSHNGVYSCALHEGEICFTNDEAREFLFKSRPNLRQTLSNLKTIAQLKADKTRIFKFNCSHTYSLYPLQFLGSETVEAEVEAHPPVTIPKNITETKLQERLSA